MENALSSGKWNLQRFRMTMAGVSQDLSRLSWMAACGHVTRVESSVVKTRKVQGPRMLQPSSWGMICPADTPEGEGCGLTKNLAMTCHITIDEDEEEKNILEICKELGVKRYDDGE